MSNRAKIEALLVEANAAGLEGLGWLSQFPIETLAREYNGIGPEWAGAALREKATGKLAIFEAAALIHDLRNFESDGSDDGFIFANREFLANCLKLANHHYPWYSWRRYRARAVAFALYEFVSGAGGYIAWQQAHQRRTDLPARASAQHSQHSAYSNDNAPSRGEQNP